MRASCSNEFLTLLMEANRVMYVSQLFLIVLYIRAPFKVFVS